LSDDVTHNLDKRTLGWNPGNNPTIDTVRGIRLTVDQNCTYLRKWTAGWNLGDSPTASNG